MLRVLGQSDRTALQGLFDADPWVNVFVEHRVNITGLHNRWVGGQIWGWFEGQELIAACHAGSNLIPVNADAPVAREFAEYAARNQARCNSLVGPRQSVLAMWERLQHRWGPARSPREHQPFLVLDREPSVEADPRVRPVVLDEFELLYPASAAMFSEEVGIDPERDNPSGYRARVRQLIAQGCAFAIIENDQVLFKAEVGALTSRAYQIQGVWVAPHLRGQGLSESALAGMIRQAQLTIAPVATLYVNGHNQPARRLYRRVGFREHTSFATILL